MKIVYIAGKLRGATSWAIEQNVRYAEGLGLDVARLGAMPLIPHANTRFFQGECTDQLWLEGTLELLRRSDAVLMVPGWETSQGALGEKKEADQLGKPVFFSVAEVAKWLGTEGSAAARYAIEDVAEDLDCLRWQTDRTLPGQAPCLVWGSKSERKLWLRREEAEARCTVLKRLQPGASLTEVQEQV